MVSRTRFVADTHALWWYFRSPERLSVAASAVFQLAETGNATVVVPAIVVAEFYYLSVKLGSPPRTVGAPGSTGLGERDRIVRVGPGPTGEAGSVPRGAGDARPADRRGGRCTGRAGGDPGRGAGGIGSGGHRLVVDVVLAIVRTLDVYVENPAA